MEDESDASSEGRSCQLERTVHSNPFRPKTPFHLLLSAVWLWPWAALAALMVVRCREPAQVAAEQPGFD